MAGDRNAGDKTADQAKGGGGGRRRSLLGADEAGRLAKAVRTAQASLAKMEGVDTGAITKVRQGVYSVAGGRGVHVRLVRGTLLVRVGGGWVEFTHYCERMATTIAPGVKHGKLLMSQKKKRAKSTSVS